MFCWRGVLGGALARGAGRGEAVEEEVRAELRRRAGDEALRAYLAETHPAVASELDVALSDAVERALEEDQESVPAHIGAPDWADAQLPIGMVHALEMGDVLHFEDLFQRLTDLAPSQVSRALYDLGMEGLAIACKAVELDRNIFGKIFCRYTGSVR